MGELLLELDTRDIIEDNSPVNIKIVNNTHDNLRYKILTGKDGIWETLREFEKGNEFIWNPKEDGEYMIMVQGRKENSTKPFDYKVTQSVNVKRRVDGLQNEIKEEKLIKGIYLNKDVFNVGEKAELKVDSNNENIMYRYFISGKNGWQLIKDYTLENKLNYTINESGQFEFLIECKKTSSTNTADDYATVIFTSKEFVKPEIINFINLSEKLIVNSELTFEVEANFEDERTALYKFVKISPDGSRTCIQDFSSNRIVTFKEFKEGRYKLLCLIRDMYSNKEFDDRAVMVYDIKPYEPLQLRSFTTDLSSPQEKGEVIEVKAVIDGGSDILYRFKIDGEISEDTGYTRNSTLKWNAKKEGNYRITLWAKDESFIGDYEVESKLDYKIEKKVKKPIKITELIFDRDKTPIINEVIKLRVSADGGTDLKYSFLIIKDGKTIESIDFGSNNWVEFIPNEKGNYQLDVRVKDKYSTKEYDVHTVLNFKVREYAEGKIDHILVPAKEYFLVGDDIDIEVIVQNTRQVKVKYVTKVNGQVVEETDYVKNKRFKVTPKCPGKYTIDIFARNIKCKEGFDSRREVRFYVSEALPITDTKISASDKVFKINEEINFSTKCEGGSRVCYEYYIMINGNWSLVQKYSRKSYYSFRPYVPGKYKVLVLTKSYYKKCAYEDYDTFEFKVE
ncbi:triple tyrosine motif-containing protein [Clostridium perfringens]|uniref:triple tyrosine motif-containing protein n=1 Tax=Clostridium perfringens TaxID=1502 RepID=UPI0024BC1CC8|nr:triple tyrosine motif-containing protein [Clostridium perfringens]MDK0538715.1 triple tyrosine motif-containing protein [Clostridium perfringens]MDK0565532.1 triple tyrosine motif-containing protein [Clostridium perfringens]MDK0793811.1 triple tyrosine motif-containing protein [Clostridium perfringens]MDM0455684.1 triple tyrosine motif-containing protein [Clostridium perfringens]